MAFYQKYRPKTFSDLVGEDHIRETLLLAVKSDRLSHAYLLCGPRGTGKTSTARLLAKIFNCHTIIAERITGKKISGEPCNKCQSCLDINVGRAVDVVEIDAASHTKVDEIREVIEKAQFVPTREAKKIYIVDEVHMLSASSFNALLKTLEEPPKHVIFILATTEVHKLPATILSRTQRFDFRRIAKDDIVNNIKEIAANEKIAIDDDALELIAISAEGGHRDAIGALEQVASVSKKITKDLVENILGMGKSTEVFAFLRAIFNANPEEGLKIAHRLYSDGANMIQFNKQVIEALRKILLVRASGEVLFEDTEDNIKSVKTFSLKRNTGQIIEYIKIFLKTVQLLKDTSFPILPIEMAVVESCDSELNHESRITNHESSNLTMTDKTGILDKNKVVISAHSTSLGQTPVEAQKNTILDPRAKPEDNNIKRPENDKEGDIEDKNHNNLNDDIKNHNLKSIIHDSETQSIAVFQMTNDLWQKVIDEAKKENTTLAALLRDAKPLEVDGNKVKLGVKFPFHKEKISEPKNCAFLEKIFGQITGSQCVVSCEIVKSKPKMAVNSKSDLIKAAEEIFA